MTSHARAILLAALLATATSIWNAFPAHALTSRDMAASVGLGNSSITQGRNPIFDADGDGLKDDLLVNTHNSGASLLRRGQPSGTFAAYLPNQFPKDDRHGCVAADFGSPNGGRPDGRADLYCTLGACSGRGPAACGGRRFLRELWLQRPGGGFVDEGPAWGLGAENDRGRDVTVLDANRDGLPDLVTAAEGSATAFSANRLFLNRGGRFQEVLQSPIRAVKGSECAASFVKLSGFPDVLLCADPGNTGGVGVLTYKNNGGTFVDDTSSRPYRNLAAHDIELADVTGDGRPDLIVTTYARVSVWANNGFDGFPRETFTRTIAQARDSAVCDVDRDGDLDLYVVTGKARGAARQLPDLLLLNNGRGGAYTVFPGIPQATAGEGDIATCYQNYVNGPAILVTNGRWTTPGPNQFIVFSGTPPQ